MDGLSATGQPRWAMGWAIDQELWRRLSINADAPKDVLATAYYAYDAALMAEMAGAIGREEEAKSYTRLFETIKQAFIRLNVRSYLITSLPRNPLSHEGSILERRGYLEKCGSMDTYELSAAG